MGMSCATAGVGGDNESTRRNKKMRNEQESFAARRRALDGFPSPRCARPGMTRFLKVPVALTRRSPGMTRFLALPNAVLAASGPDDALAHLYRRRHAFVEEALDSFSFIGF